jgi:hypothetical protein
VWPYGTQHPAGEVYSADSLPGAYNAKSFRWQGLFILYGGMTFVIGLAMFFLLAASPTEAKWLTEEEKVIALERVRQNKTGTEVWRFSWPQLREALMDVRLYMMFFLLVSTGLPNGGVTAFCKSVFKRDNLPRTSILI